MTRERAAALLMGALVVASLPTAARAEVTQMVPVRWVEGLNNGQIVHGSSQSTTATADGATMTLVTNGLHPGHTYTLWFTFFENPDACMFPPNLPDTTLRCGFADLLNPETDGNLVFGDGLTATGEGDTFFATVAAGVPPEGERSCDNGLCSDPKVAFAYEDEDTATLTDPLSAEYQATLRSHGPEDPDYMPEQVSTLNGGCEEGEPYHPCRDEQASGARAQIPFECTEEADCLASVIMA